MWEPMKPAPPEITYRKRCPPYSMVHSVQNFMLDPTWPEVALLLTLTAVSVFLFLRRFAPCRLTSSEARSRIPGFDA